MLTGKREAAVDFGSSSPRQVQEGTQRPAEQHRSVMKTAPLAAVCLGQSSVCSFSLRLCST